MSQRILRVRELLKREIGTLISQDYSFNALVTVNDVDVTPSLFFPSQIQIHDQSKF